MQIPEFFAFSQNSLQDFVDCPRRFELRYLEKLSWPAVRSEPALEVERHMLMGQRFHLMVQQHQTGLSPELIAPNAGETQLDEWWQAYLDHVPTGLPSMRKVEFMLTAPFNRYRLIAKYDLLAISPGQQAFILDWKTNLKKPRRQTLLGRMQTRLYPFLLVEAGAALNGGIKFLPEQVELIYWFTADPRNPEHFPYTAAKNEEDRAFLTTLIGQIEAASRSDFHLTGDERMCQFCNYRSLCDRGNQAGEIDDSETEEDEITTGSGFDLDFYSVSEINF